MTTEFEKKKAILRDIINSCPIYSPSPYEEDKDVWFGVNVESGHRMELRLDGYRFKLMRGAKRVKSTLIKDVNPEKFKEYIYSIVGVMPPK